MGSSLFILVLLAAMLVITNGTHFRGGIISWRALNTTPSGSTAQILVHQRYAWRRTYFSPTLCTNATITTRGLIGTGTGNLRCYTGGSCSSFATVSADVNCTDFSAPTDYSLGERYDTYNLSLNTKYTVGFVSTNWLVLAIKGNGNWSVMGHIDLALRPDGIINTSPVTSTLPVIYRTVNVQHVHVVQMSDADTSDTLQCRWATSNASAIPNNCDECGSVCSPSLPTFTLFPNNCTLVYTITAVNNYYAVALQIEDFYNSTTTTPMSSVPIQFLFYGIAAPSGCSTAPQIIGSRPNLACIGTPIGNLTVETVIAQVGCPGKTIIEFTTSSPIGLIKSGISNPSTGIYTMTLSFTPTASQYGPQGFCAGAIDNTSVQSDPWCITFLVGFTAPDLQTPVLVQGSASPLGTVFANQSVFSIQSKNNVKVNRPSHNYTYVSFHDATLNGTVVLQYDCGYSSNVNYAGDTIIITAPYNWTVGHRYYVTFDSGATSGNDFCHAESAPLIDPNFWQFDIWDPGLSSTTTTTTTPPTTHTITTRPPSTTTPIPNMTTTGVIVTTTLPLITTVTVTTATTSTTETTTSATSALTDQPVISSKDFEENCKQTVAVATAVTCLVMLAINMIGMFAMFVKLEKMFNPDRIQAFTRHKNYINRTIKRK